MVFQSTNRKAYDQLARIIARDETCRASIMLDCYSISALDLHNYIETSIASTSDSIQQSSANTEVLLKFYNWDIYQLKKDFSERAEQVLANARILPTVSAMNGMMVVIAVALFQP